MNTKNFFTPTRRYKTLVSSMHSIYRLVNSTFELKDLVSRLARLLCQIFSAHYCLIIILDLSKKYSILKCKVCDREKFIIDKRKKITNRIEKKIIRACSSIRDNCLLGIPLVSEDIMGLIIVRRLKRENSFDRYDEEIMMAIAEQAIIGIKNLQLCEEQQRTVLGGIKSLVTLLDTRIPQEFTHSSYFSGLVVAIAEQMHLDEKQTESLRYASLLHDAGKIDVPLEILTKTTKLTAKEYTIIKTHPAMGAQLLRPFQVLRPVIPIILHHHEKYDGSGYPARLRKNQIPLGARVMAVADAFEAMVYGRPYRQRLSLDEAIKEIKEKSGSQFDPLVVENFLKIAKKYYKKYLQPHKQGV